MKPITFVTSNSKKLEEFVAILGPNFPRIIKTQKIDLVEIQGDIDEICQCKCREAALLVDGPVLVEDVSLCFNALNGLPGPYIKSFLAKLDVESLYKILTNWEDKSAKAICTVAYCSGEKDNDEILLFKGVTEGDIVLPRGPRNFGWDQCFQPKGFTKTYAEMEITEKNKISHRYRALCKLREHFTK